MEKSAQYGAFKSCILSSYSMNCVGVQGGDGGRPDGAGHRLHPRLHCE